MIKFWKMHGLGNDFAVIDTSVTPLAMTAQNITHLSHRQIGIGFDQLLLVEKSMTADFACRIFNADGQEAEQCGNGLRCVARFIHENRLSTKNAFTIETAAGIAHIHIISYEKIQVKMGNPDFNPENIPFLTKEKKSLYEMPIDSSNKILQFSALSLGNPHVIMNVPHLEKYPVQEMGAEIAEKDIFPKGANVGFMQIINPNTIRLRTFERGVGETYACGSNACAAVIAGIMNHGLARSVTVELRLGNLWIEWPNEAEPIQMTGPAEFVYAGELKKSSMP